MTDDLGMTVPPEQGGLRSSELVGLLLCLRPTRFDETLETSIGPSLATWCEVLVVDRDDPGDHPYENGGEVPIFWTVVRTQLHSAAPWMVGRIRKVEKGNAFRLYPPEDDEALEACRRALLRHRDNPIPYVGVQEELVPFGDESLDDGPGPF